MVLLPPPVPDLLVPAINVETVVGLVASLLELLLPCVIEAGLAGDVGVGKLGWLHAVCISVVCTRLEVTQN